MMINSKDKQILLPKNRGNVNFRHVVCHQCSSNRRSRRKQRWAIELILFITKDIDLLREIKIMYRVIVLWRIIFHMLGCQT